MTKNSKPRAGSMQYAPRGRAGSATARIRTWPKSGKGASPLAFAGYKAGMTHLFTIDQRETETKGKEIFTPCTIVETPPLVCFAITAHKKTPYGLKTITQINSDKPDKNLARKLVLPKKQNKTISDLEKLASEKQIDDIRLLTHTQPRKAPSEAKKKPEIIEIALSGELNEKIEYAKNRLGKEIPVSEVFKPGETVDVIAVTKGYGTQGPVARFGVKIKKRKHRVAKGRHVGSIGDRGTQTPWYTPMAGQDGYHQRCDCNKIILKIAGADENINPKGGMPNYGLVRNEYMLLRGTIPGNKKRCVSIRKAVRQTVESKAPQITYTSLEPKQ